jgi:hypothetical protein
MGVSAFDRGEMMVTVPTWRAGRDPLSEARYSDYVKMVKDKEIQAAAMENSTLGKYASQPYLDLKQMIFMRLHMSVGELIPFEFLEAHRSGETVHVFVVVNGHPVTLSDGHTLFPSDELITKLNLLRK